MQHCNKPQIQQLFFAHEQYDGSVCTRKTHRGSVTQVSSLGSGHQQPLSPPLPSFSQEFSFTVAKPGRVPSSMESMGPAAVLPVSTEIYRVDTKLIHSPMATPSHQIITLSLTFKGEWFCFACDTRWLQTTVSDRRHY